MKVKARIFEPRSRAIKLFLKLINLFNEVLCSRSYEKGTDEDGEDVNGLKYLENTTLRYRLKHMLDLLDLTHFSQPATVKQEGANFIM